MNTVWKLYPQSAELSAKIAQTLNIQPAVAQVLLNRNLRSLADIQAFLNPPHPTQSTDTLEAAELQNASEIVCRCIADQTRILVYGDYDADGVTSVSIVAHALKQAGATVAYYIPDRFSEGYGLSDQIVSIMHDHRAGCLITLDCGISNFKEISAIKAELNAAVIILDHHIEPEQRPPADAILNPKQLDPTHNAHYLCTAGIAYKWMCYLAQHHQWPINPDDYLDLATIGTIADIAPLIGENRAIAKAGLPALQQSKRAGLRQLLALSQLRSPQISVRDVGFVIAPKINAAGRLKHAKMGVELLLSDDTAAASLAQSITTLNEKRQEIGQFMVADAEAQLAANPDWAQCPVIALASDGWHSGVIGITAAQLARKYSRPVVLIAIRDGIGRASARTFGSVNIYELLHKCNDLFLTFGGHKEAAGFSIEFGNISAFLNQVRYLSTQHILPEALTATLMIDGHLSPADMTLALAQSIETLSPFGPRNEVPVFYSNQLKAVDYRPVGNGDHLKVTFSDAQGTMAIDAIGFGLAKKRPILQKTFPELAFTIEINTWQNRKMVQLNLLDMK